MMQPESARAPGSVRWLTHLLAPVTTAGWRRKKQQVREQKSECIHRRTWPLLHLKQQHR